MFGLPPQAGILNLVMFHLISIRFNIFEESLKYIVLSLSLSLILLLVLLLLLLLLLSSLRMTTLREVVALKGYEKERV